MRRTAIGIALIAALAASYTLGRRHSPTPSASNTQRRVLYYVDPMHPSYRSDKPGIAPDCGMQLEPVYAGSAGSAQPSEGAVRIDSEMRRRMGIRLAAVEQGGATRVLHVAGRVVPEDSRVYRLNSGVDGFVREISDDSVGARVRKDQKLGSYYAPEFVSNAQGFLAAYVRTPGYVARPNSPPVIQNGQRSVQTYSDRLRNLGVSETQIQQMAESGELPDSIDILSPVDGFILARNISAGQHFTHDTEFYRVADLTKVWVVAEVFEQEMPFLLPGASARLVLQGMGRELPAHITDSLPQSQEGGGTVKLRLEADNPGFALRPDMLVDVELAENMPPAVTAPLDALVDSGKRTQVYVERGDGAYEPREVHTGWRSADRVEILSGLRPGEKVVAGATFLVDSESRLQAPDARAANPAAPAPASSAAATVKDPSCGMPVDPAKAAAAGNTLAYGGSTYYFCSQKCRQTFLKQAGTAAARPQGD